MQVTVDDALMTEAMAVTGLPAEQVAADVLRRAIQRHHRLRAQASMEGQGWDGDLDAMREGRSDTGR